LTRKKKLEIALIAALFALVFVLYESIGTVVGALILGLLVVAVLALAFLGLAVRNSSYARSLILRVAKDAPGWNSGAIPMSWQILLCTAIVGAVVGLTFYADRVQYFYSSLADAYCRADVVSTLLSFEPGQHTAKSVLDPPHAHTACLTDWRATMQKPPAGTTHLKPHDVYKLLRHFGLLSEDETRGGPKEFGPPTPAEGGLAGTPNRLIADTIADPKFAEKFAIGVPTLDFIIALSEGKDSDRQDPGYEVTWTRLALASDLGQLPASWGWSPEPLSIRQPDRCNEGPSTKKCMEEGRFHVRDLENQTRHGLIAERPQELTAHQITGLLNEWTTPTGGKVVGAIDDAMDGAQVTAAEAIPRFEAALIDALRNDDEVRRQRVYVNAIVGPERALIFMLAFWFVALLMSRAVQALPHRAHAIEIKRLLAEYEVKWRQEPASAETRLATATALHEMLSEGEEIDTAAIDKEIKENWGATAPASANEPSPIRTIPSALLEAAIKEMQSRQPVSGRTIASNLPDTRSIETAAEGLQGNLRHSRLIFDALLPTFPAIGFIATVSSLLIAMSKADQIVKAADPMARGIATSAVTDTLSLCFATTFMALICLVILTPLSMRQDGIEQQLIEDTEADLQRVLRPEQP
jgi:hypothetical protein